MESRLCYNGTDRLYEVRLGLRVLSSHPTKDEAFLAQLAGEAPRALELAQSLSAAHPELAERCLKAVALVAQDAVQPAGDPHHFHVLSQGKGQEAYEVDLDQSTCTCADWMNRAPTVSGRRLCKHLLAALFVRKLGPLARKPPVRTEVSYHDRA